MGKVLCTVLYEFERLLDFVISNSLFDYLLGYSMTNKIFHDDVVKWKHFPRYWPFVRGIHRSPVDSPRNGQWRTPLMFSLIYAGTNGWAINRDAGDLRHHRSHYDVIVMFSWKNEHLLKSCIPLSRKDASSAFLEKSLVLLACKILQRHLLFTALLSNMQSS